MAQQKKQESLLTPPTAPHPPNLFPPAAPRRIVEIIQQDSRDGFNVRVAWFYRPEEARGGRKSFHGEKELFKSDHYDWVDAKAINGKCRVHTLKAYQALHMVGEMDYFSRFKYAASTGEFKPDRVPVYCLCEMPYNPDLFMVECEGCDEWFHPECLRLTKKEVEKMAHLICPECTKKHLKPKVPAGSPPPAKKARQDVK